MAQAWQHAFSDEGRINRQQFWLFCAAVVGIVLTCFLLLMLFGVPARIRPVLISLALLYPAYCAIARRLQDIDVSGSWAIIMTAIAAADTLFSAAGPNAALGVTLATMRGLFWYVALANTIVFLALGLIPGTRGGNRFGGQPA